MINDKVIKKGNCHYRESYLEIFRYITKLARVHYANRIQDQSK